MTVIIGIALANLLLGFAVALLMGRGPRSWADVDRAIVVRYFSPHLFLLRSGPSPKPTALQISTVSTRLVESSSPPTLPEQDQNGSDGPPKGAPAAARTGEDGDQPGAAVPPDGADTVVRKVTLQPKAAAQFDANQPPETVLNAQLDAWRHDEDRDETPSMTGLCAVPTNEEFDDTARARLMDAVHAKISGQLRKDRRVIRLEPDQFAWFSEDMHPEDACMPAERIRQMISQTRFENDGTTIHVEVHAAVAAGTDSDQATDLIGRLQDAMKHGLEKTASQTCLDLGQGPDSVDLPEFEIEDSVCKLDV